MAKRKTDSKGSTPDVGKPYQVFVSHATADKWLARILCEKIDFDHYLSELVQRVRRHHGQQH